MASDLISRAALLAEYDRVHVGEAGGARKLIAEAPAVDAEPVRHGEWGETQIIGYDGIHPVYAKPCSECGYMTELYKPNYCPTCGAKMDGGKQDADEDGKG